MYHRAPHFLFVCNIANGPSLVHASHSTCIANSVLKHVLATQDVALHHNVATRCPWETMTLNSRIVVAVKVLRGMREGNVEKSWQCEMPTITHFNLSAPANFRMSRNAEQSSYTHRNVNNVRSRPPLTSANTGTTLQPI